MPDAMSELENEFEDNLDTYIEEWEASLRKAFAADDFAESWETEKRDQQGQWTSGNGDKSNWLSVAKHLPAKALHKARQVVRDKYAQLEKRYGRKYALAIIGAGLAGVPIPAPGASLLMAAPLVAVAEIHRALSARLHDEQEAFAELTTEEIETLGKEFIDGLKV